MNAQWIQIWGSDCAETVMFASVDQTHRIRSYYVAYYPFLERNICWKNLFTDPGFSTGSGPGLGLGPGLDPGFF